MAQPRRILSVSLVVALLAAGLACGGENGAAPDGDAGEAAREDFEQAVEDARDDVQAVVDEVTAARNADDVVSAMDAGADRLFEASNRLEQADAPERAREGQRDLVRALDDLATDLQQAAADVDRGDFRDAIDSLQALDALDDVRSALERLRAADVDVEPLGP